MKNPNIKTKVVHSQTKAAWNIVCTTLGGKYKIARFPYLTDAARKETFDHAEFVSYCFNNSDTILAGKILDNE